MPGEPADDAEEALAQAEKWFAAEMEMESKVAADREATEKAELEKAELEKAAAVKAELEKAAAVTAALEKAAAEKAAAEKAAAEKAAAEKAAAEKAAAEKAAAEKAAADKAAAEKAAAEKEFAAAEEAQGDAPEDPRPKLKTPIHLSRVDATPNALPSSDGRLLMTLCDGGFQYLLAGIRANTAVRGGRYMFEVRIVETLGSPKGAQDALGVCPSPMHLVRVGFSAASTSVLFEGGDAQVFVDSEGGFSCGGEQKASASKPFVRGQTIAVVLNLGSGPTGAFSVYCNGVCICRPRRLPVTFQGKALYPTIAYKNVTLQVNFGPLPRSTLPFKCRMLQDAAEADVEVLPPPSADRCEVIFPIGLPDQGIFDWLDAFMEKHPDYVELSDRKVLDWARRSSLIRPKGYTSCESNDKPGMAFGLPCLDDLSIQKMLSLLAPVLRRRLILMELKSNLIAAERRTTVAQFSSKYFRRVAVVAMGEPPEEIQARSQKTCATPDLSQSVLARSYADFSLPAEEEGFDEIRYVWKDATECAAHLRSWILALKKTQVVEHLEPSTWFKDRWTEWHKVLQSWKTKQSEVKEAKKGAELDVHIDGDVDSVENILDVGDGTPIFACFEYEDWALLGVRYELVLLLHAFKQDLNDPDRPSFVEAHLPCYYEKYIGKAFSLETYNVKTLEALLELIPDAAKISAEEPHFLEVLLPADTKLEKFVRLTEGQRRERLRCIEAGDETAALKFPRPPEPEIAAPAQKPVRKHPPKPPSRPPPSYLVRAQESRSRMPNIDVQPSRAIGAPSSRPESTASSQKRPYPVMQRTPPPPAPPWSQSSSQAPAPPWSQSSSQPPSKLPRYSPSGYSSGNAGNHSDRGSAYGDHGRSYSGAQRNSSGSHSAYDTHRGASYSGGRSGSYGSSQGNSHSGGSYGRGYR